MKTKPPVDSVVDPENLFEGDKDRAPQIGLTKVVSKKIDPVGNIYLCSLNSWGRHTHIFTNEGSSYI